MTRKFSVRSTCSGRSGTIPLYSLIIITTRQPHKTYRTIRTPRTGVHISMFFDVLSVSNTNTIFRLFQAAHTVLLTPPLTIGYWPLGYAWGIGVSGKRLSRNCDNIIKQYLRSLLWLLKGIQWTSEKSRYLPSQGKNHYAFNVNEWAMETRSEYSKPIRKILWVFLVTSVVTQIIVLEFFVCFFGEVKITGAKP